MAEQPARLYSPLEDGKLRCELCAHRCLIPPGQKGLCRVRENRDGELIALSYGRLIAAHVDPIEKKPLYHFLPGSLSYSISSPGCNFRCQWCQNADISQISSVNAPEKPRFVSPERVVEAALDSGCKSIAYTYTEPTLSFEYNLAVSQLAREMGLRNIYVTNGYMTAEMLALSIPTLDAANVDIKAFDEAIHKRYTGARLQPVLETCEALFKAGVWLEITTLLIPGLNDSDGELKEIAAFIRKLGAETPWHISRFYPQFRMLDRPGTPVSSLHRACEIGKEAGLYYVYSGNIPGDEGENTYCAGCSALLIHRYGYKIIENKLTGGACPSCGRRLDGLF